ncbi:MAG TPA: hypothetical protein VHI99_22955 [Vicinamibacterales bacterium]|jgi:photosystem II stability/assembly factor-like uncharacterized protein|nr:hypothetical protein [Vicinamibacterales bacterium]
MTLRSVTAAAILVAAGLTWTTRAQGPAEDPFNERLLQAFSYRNVGPFRMGARTSDIAVPSSPAKAHLYTFYVSFWTGGVWKTTNNGTTFEPVFDAERKLTIGDVTVAPSNADIVWVGTGDGFTSRSSYAGDGVYKSTDAGKTWKNVGLKDSHHIPRIVINPTNPDIVFVASMGHLFSENEERGVFRTTDGGATWEKVLYVSPKVGVIDLVMNPKNPSILYAATYDKERKPWQIVNGGPGTGIYKTTDSGKTWTRLSGGLPTGRIGRIGLDIYLKNPDILYAVIENQNETTRAPGGREGSEGEGGGRGQQPGVVRTIGGEVYRTADGGTTWKKMNADDYNVSPKGPYYFSQLRVDPNDDQNIFVTQDGYRHSLDGGKTWDAPRVFPRMFGDFRTLWIDPENSDRMIAGSDGGIAMSYDGGVTSDHFANIPVGEIYMISVDMEEPYNLYAGLQDHENWRGPSNTGLGRVTVWDWLAVGDGDGMSTLVDQSDPQWLYTNREYGSHYRLNQKTGVRTSIMPRRPAGQPPYRFLWETPIYMSPHDPKVIYTGGQVLLRSIDRGDHWTEISPDLSTNPADKILPSSEGGVPGGIPWFAISSISESPITRGVIWAGTSDGKVHVTKNDGAAWTDVTAKITAVGGREDAYVSRVRASSHVAGRAFVSKTGYRFDDFRPYLYRTEDFGETWTPIVNNLPNEPINVIYEDRKNPNLLFVGNDTGVFVSIDGGARWVKMNNNMPNVPVKDLLVHPRDNDLVLGSYGRDFWITNISPLQEMTAAVLAKPVHLFAIDPTVQRITWSFAANDYLFGQRHLQTPNQTNGMVIRYYLKSQAPSAPTIVVTDSAGKDVARLQGSATPGINTVLWTMRPQGEGRGGRGGGRGGNPLDQLAPLGDYTVTLQVGETKLTQPARITKTQGWSLAPSPTVIRQ